MDPSAFFKAATVHIVAGKGGVGKTSVTAALGLAAAQCGFDVLLVEIEGRGALASLFGDRTLGYDDVVLADRIRGRSLSADEALVEYLAEHGFGPLARRMIDTGLVEVVSRGAPGMKDILLLGKIKQLERSAAADVILVDAPASGHAITFLRSPQGLADAVASGPINTQAQEVLELLNDASRCQVLLVTRAEETPVNEAVETAFNLEDEIGVHLGPLFVNDVWAERRLPADVRRAARQAGASLPEDLRRSIDAAAAHHRQKRSDQQTQLDRLAERLPLPRVEISHRYGARLDLDDLAALAGEILVGVRALGEP